MPEETINEEKTDKKPWADISTFFQMNEEELYEALEHYSKLLDRFRAKAHHIYDCREEAYHDWKTTEAKLWHDGKTKGTNPEDRRAKSYTLCKKEIDKHKDLMIKEDLMKSTVRRLEDRLALINKLIDRGNHESPKNDPSD